MTKSKVQIVVLDGLDWEWCSDNMQHCEALWEIVGEGCAAKLNSVTPPVTSCAVASLLTGRPVVLDWKSNKGRYATSAELIRESPWFFELRRMDMTVGLCNVPLTWPAFPMPKGSWCVSGYEIPTTKTVHKWFWPRSLNVNDYPIDGVVADSTGGPGGLKDLDALHETEKSIVEWMKTAPRADVEIVWLRSTDPAGHHFWGTDQYGKAVDRITALTTDLYELTDNQIIISDHGFSSVDDPRCEAYMATEHGPTTKEEGLVGAHTYDGILFARGEDIHARGVLPTQQLLEVAGGVFDLLQLPPAPGMVSNGPDWIKNTTPEQDEKMADQLRSLGYIS